MSITADIFVDSTTPMFCRRLDKYSGTEILKVGEPMGCITIFCDSADLRRLHDVIGERLAAIDAEAHRAYICTNNHVFTEPGEKQTREASSTGPAEYDACCPECGDVEISEGVRCSYCGAWHESVESLRGERCTECEADKESAA